MTQLEARLSELLATHHGVATLSELRRNGVSDDRIRHMVAIGRLRSVSRGVFVATDAPPSAVQKAALACAITGGVISHETAGRMWGFRGLPQADRPHITVRGECRPRTDTATIHRSNQLTPVDIVTRGDGIKVTSPPRTCFDLAWRLPADDLESIIEQCLDRQMLTMPTLWATARRLTSIGRAGSGRFADVLSSRPTWSKPVGSDHELRLERALVAAGAPQPIRQYPIALGSGVVLHPDLAWPDRRGLIEVDHATWHGGRLASTRDRRRDHQLRLLDWESLRVTDSQIDHDLVATVRDLVIIVRDPWVLRAA